ncbi:TetR/AcrR family transcriptional regulator [Saccharopolyspora taberi]|uniref:TetR/AcrR family transcriptional regulator n=1 Tax=Saccharopolyspora taberi TaxID=60895 RepID=A0ABN3V9U9_9PSEU
MRTRLDTQRRREQLLAIGARLFADRPYDEVWIEEVAEIAQVSRSLLYHYFSSKKEFFAEVVRAESDRILALTEPKPALTVREQLDAGLDAYLDYVEQHREGYRILHRASTAVDAEIRRICEDGIARQRDRILAALSAEIRTDEVTEVAVRGWLSFVITVCLEWTDRPTIDRTELRDLCTRTLLTAVDLT